MRRLVRLGAERLWPQTVLPLVTRGAPRPQKACRDLSRPRHPTPGSAPVQGLPGATPPHPDGAGFFGTAEQPHCEPRNAYPLFVGLRSPNQRRSLGHARGPSSAARSRSSVTSWSASSWFMVQSPPARMQASALQVVRARHVLETPPGSSTRQHSVIIVFIISNTDMF